MSKAKSNDWRALTELTQGKPILVERVRLQNSDIVIEGAFELPRLAQMSAEDQVFVAAFIRSHGSIKDMEKAFGVSYPTVKNRLNRIAEQLRLVVVETPESIPAPAPTDDVLGMLERGEIGAVEAAERLRS